MTSSNSAPKWWLATDAAHLARAAAHLVMETVSTAIAARGQAVLAVSGGSTPKKLFETLASDYYKSRIAWDKIHLFWVDERCVPPNHPDSNFGMMRTALLSKVSLPESHIHRFHGESNPPIDAARAYESELKSFFNVDKSLPIFDLVLLGLGEDGHTASLFPKTDALDETQKWTAAPFIEKLNAYRLTMTLPVINAARKVIFLVAGSSKSAILNEILGEALPGNGHGRLPAQRVAPGAGELIWLFDREAASKFPHEVRFKALHLEDIQI